MVAGSNPAGGASSTSAAALRASCHNREAHDTGGRVRMMRAEGAGDAAASAFDQRHARMSSIVFTSGIVRRLATGALLPVHLDARSLAGVRVVVRQDPRDVLARPDVTGASVNYSRGCDAGEAFHCTQGEYAHLDVAEALTPGCIVYSRVQCSIARAPACWYLPSRP